MDRVDRLPIVRMPVPPRRCRTVGVDLRRKGWLSLGNFTVHVFLQRTRNQMAFLVPSLPVLAFFLRSSFWTFRM